MATPSGRYRSVVSSATASRAVVAMRGLWRWMAASCLGDGELDGSGPCLDFTHPVSDRSTGGAADAAPRAGRACAGAGAETRGRHATCPAYPHRATRPALFLEAPGRAGGAALVPDRPAGRARTARRV